MKRWVLAITGLLLAVSGPVASAKDLPTLDAFSSSTPPVRWESRAQIQERAKGARVSSIEPRTGVPTFVWGDKGGMDERFLSAVRRMSPEQAARAHLDRLAPLYKLAPHAAFALPSSVTATGKGPVLITFKQDVEGVEVFRDALKVLLNERNELIAISGTLTPHAAPRAQAGKLRFALDARSAIAAAYQDLQGEPLDPASLLTMEQKGAYTSYDISATDSARYAVRMITPARAKKVFFPLVDRLVPAWYVEIHTGVQGRPEADYYSYVVSAQDGQLLFRNNLTASDAFSYRVWAQTTTPYLPHDGPQGLNGTPHPTGLPDGYQAPFVAPSLVTLQNSPYSMNDPWLPAGATETVGNNVDAYADVSGADGLDGVDFRATTTAPSTFDRVYDVTQDPDVSVDQAMAAVTQLFYVNNFLHDWYYDAGFNEFSGNAQNDNYGRGGEEGDSLRAEAQDFGGLDNANMSTPADGARPRMQMYLFTPNVASNLTVTAPPSIAGTYAVGTAAFGPQAFNVTSNIVLVQDSGGASTTDGCEAPFINAAQIAGNIAFIDRGSCAFALKTKNAQDAGAVGVIIANNVAGPAPGMAGDDPTIIIPTLSVSLDDGNLIRAQFPGGPVTGRLFRESAPYRDGSLDNGVVAHEWGHYISNRLVGNANGLFNNQGRSMGEGWADFHALLMMVREEDKQVPGNANFEGAYSASGYVASGGTNNGYYWGLRRYPYSTDFTKNPLTFRHIQDSATLPVGPPMNPDLIGLNNAEVHNSGEVWATMLWECYTALLRDSSRLSFQEAQDRMKLYLVFAYQFTPIGPTFIEARDALLAIAYVFDETDYRLLHAAFARRGAGLRAEAPHYASTNHEGVVESFATGKDVGLGDVALAEAPGACDADGVLDNGEAGSVRVTLYNTGTETLTQTTARLTTSDPGFTIPNNGIVSFPPMEPFSSATVEIPLALDGPPGIRVVTFNLAYSDADQDIPGEQTAQFQVRINTDDVENAGTSDDVESNIEAWTADRDPDYDEYFPWFRYEEEPDVHYYYGVDAPLPADIYLVSPPLQVSATGNFSVSFQHRYAFEYGVDPFGFLIVYDAGVIELTNNGGATWTDIGSLIPDPDGYIGFVEPGGGNPIENRPAFGYISDGYPAWLPVTINLGTTYQGQTVQIRFRIGTDINTGSVGWDIDDLVFTGIDNTPFPALVAEQDPCTGNTAPVVDAGPDQTVNELDLVFLSGTASDPDGDALTYSWSQIAGPAVTLDDSGSLTPTFFAPNLTSTSLLTFQLTATDGQSFATDTVNITVTATNAPPVSNAGPNQSVNERTLVTLDGTGSTDPDGDPLSYTWTQTAGPTVTLSNTNVSRPTFTAPEVTAATSLAFRLTVSDGVASSNDMVLITVNNVNRAPVADAGADQTVTEGSAVTLDGTGSSDPDAGSTLSYVWTQTAGPAVTLSGASTAQPTFTAPDVSSSTTLTFQLTVSDGSLSSTDTVNVTVNNANNAPVADAGPDQTVNEGATVTLDGSGSSDPDPADLLSFQWTQTAGPSVTLSSSTAAQPTFTAPSVTATTVLTFQLTVSDGALTSTDTVNITVNNANNPPVANAGADQTVNEGATVTLNGTGSSDPDGDTLTYAWTQTAGPSVTLSSSTAAQPTFTAPSVSTSTVLTFQLTVSDGTATSTDTVNITVNNVNGMPTANAGVDQTVSEGATVTLDGTGSLDPDGDTLTYAWTQTAGPSVTLSSSTAAQPTFTAPDVSSSTVLTFQLTVSDGTLTSTDTVNITVNNVNSAPVANAGADQSVNEGATVTLDGTGSSDPDAGTTLSYAWTQTAGPAVTLSSSTAAQPTFTAPSVTATTVLTFELTVSDGTLTSTDTVNITVNNVNGMPTANAGADQTVNEGATVTLDGSGSSDPDGDTLTYTWTQTAGPAVTLSSTTAAQPTFTAPSVTATTVLTFQLTVSDGTNASTDTVNITVNNVNSAPVANAGADQTVDEGDTVTLNGSGSSDPDGDALTYTWTQTAGPSVTLSSSTAAQPTFTAPEVSGTTVLTFQLTVTDGSLTSTDTVNVTVNNVVVNTAPTPNAGADQTVDEGTTVTLDGSGSSDPDGDALTYAWTQTAGPTVTLSSTTAAQPTFTAPEVTEDTVLTFQLTVSDGELSNTDTVSITVSNVVANGAPVADAGEDQTVDEGATVTLDGSGSTDPDAGTVLSYFWTQTAGPTVGLDDPTVAQPTFTAPEVTEDTVITFELMVSDGTLTSTDTVSITVTNVAQNGAPTANAGADQSVNEGSTVTLDGSGSTDPEGGALTYAWTQTAGPSVTLSSASEAKPTFTAPSVSANTTLTFKLTVTDEQGATAEDTVSITVKNTDGGGGGEEEEEGGCGCSSDSSAGPLMPLLMLGMVMLSRRRLWAR